MENIAREPTSSAISSIQYERECFNRFIVVGESFNSLELSVRPSIFFRKSIRGGNQACTESIQVFPRVMAESGKKMSSKNSEKKGRRCL